MEAKVSGWGVYLPDVSTYINFMWRLLSLPFALLLIFQASASDRTYGEVSAIDVKSQSITVSTECGCGSDRMIELAFKAQEKTKVLLNGKAARLSDLKVGDSVDLDFNDPRDDVIKISATRSEGKSPG